MVEGQSENTHPASIPSTELDTTLYGNLERALHTDQYEVALRATEEIQSLRTWRTAQQKSPSPHFYRLFEAATRLNAAPIPPEERTRLRQELSDRLFPVASNLSPRIRDLYMGFISELDGSSYSPQFSMTERQLETLRESGDFALLQNPSVPWDIKLNRMQTRIESELLGRKALDRKDKETAGDETLRKEAERERSGEQANQSPALPPPDSDNSKPSMDEMDRLKEGETAPAIWTITPAYGGYYKEQSFDSWDKSTNTWRKKDRQKISVDPLSSSNDAPVELTISTHIPMQQWTRLPIPYHYEILNVHVDNSAFSLAKDVNGDYLLCPTDRYANVSPHEVRIYMVKKDSPDVSQNPPTEAQAMNATFSEQTKKALEDIKNSRRSDIAKAQALLAYTMRHLEYSNDSSFNAIYENYQDGYIGAIDNFRKADCDVANTYFAALCINLGIPVRHVVGHMVKDKDGLGNARITSGTGHAWSEVWDKEREVWVRMDATPAGDPQMEEKEQSEGMPGDYGGQEAVGPTDEELQELETKLQQTAERLSYTREERELAQQAGIEPREARQIVKEIQDAENTRLPNGEKVVDVMSQLWSLIAQSRMVTQQDYTGPVRKREGGEEIEDIVAHKIGIKSGESDPASRQKEAARQIPELILKSLELYAVCDKSGSMGQTVNGEEKWRLQRRAMYLTLSSLDRAEQNIQRVKTKMKTPLDIYSEVVSFRGSGDDEIDLDKPFSNEFSARDKVALWHGLGNQGWGNGDVPALSLLHEEIKAKHDRLIEQNKEDDALRIIIACSDGMPDDPGQVHSLAQQLGQLNTVVVGVGLTETATQVPIIFDTPFSRGDLVRDLSDLPAVVAKHVVMEAVKLFPQQSREQYQHSIDNILAKFAAVEK